VQCEELCVLKKISSPVAIGNLERFCADWESREGVKIKPKKKRLTGKKVGIIGAGPAGLTCASELAIRGHQVIIFEALHIGGGVLMYGIPEFRLPKKIVNKEIEYVKSLGVELLTSYVIGKIRTVDELLEEFDAIFVGTGAGLPWFMNLPGEESNGIYSANEYLVRTNLMKAYMFPKYDTPIMKSKIVVVIGGGNVAMDAARTAIRLGGEEVYVIYRRSRQEMPARIEEIRHAEEEGVKFMFLTNPVKYYSDEKGRVKEIECIKMKLGEKDASGRRKPVPILGSNFKLKVDTVIVAIGNSPNPLISNTTPGLKIGKNGRIIVDPTTGKTSKERVWAGGDIVRGAATVISAMGDGKLSALSIDKYLSSK
jgi:glutamate synthase (NADPH/NADH) small chain